MQQERQAAIDRQNQVILSALMKIKQSPARVDNWNKDWKPRFLLMYSKLFQLFSHHGMPFGVLAERLLTVLLNGEFQVEWLTN